MDGVRDRLALVTGAGSESGIGFATAKLLARQGARVALTSTTKRIFDRLAELPGAPGRHIAFAADLSLPDAAAGLVEEVRRSFGRIDILVNNAGMTQTGRRETSSLFHRISDAEWAYKLE